MKSHLAALIVALATVTVPIPAHAQMTPEAAAALQRAIAIEREEPVTSVPLIPHMGKYAFRASLDGIERQFVFDTGSPTMISRELAEELGLEVIGTNTGRDANGREITTQIAVIDRLTIGGVTFRSVPVLITDFGIADPDRCFFDGGVIGSEIFPGSVWHIDAGRQMLQIAGSLEELPDLETKADAIVARLHDSGYPHAPVFDYAIEGFEDRGLFDTGNSDTIVLFDRIADDARVKSAMIAGTVREGRGSHGVSAAGLGANTDLLRFEIEGIRLSGAELGRHSGTTRSAPPSLIGLGILDTYDVTLDYPGTRIILHPRDRPRSVSSEPGYALMASDAEVRVVQLFDASAAQLAGLELGDRVVAIDGRELSADDTGCETIQWLTESRLAQSARQLTVLRDGRRVEIDVASRRPQ
ncbi:retropepsin-like aspartic protease [Pelagerythrobacter rhizovicinus]|uniref:PDZ domain-containing protein n=1 Tax=Pelagerythrobacter rhizovicinus TaxID=2268576 RepID=A0A4Q2KJF0_9SPHN|nr:aspartyl protease family protein [Pelagerythrobacter rhizovicinus]RXZ65345.1 PDZ domain-containing protein [Pelagerythrobacter rhizovicinus]